MPSAVLYALSLHDALPICSSHIWDDEDFEDVEEEDEEEENPDPRPKFTPSTPQEARNQAELDRWAKVEADRLAILGAKQRAAEDRKSTRLNSSHVAISYAVRRALRSFPTRRSSDLFLPHLGR